MTCRTPIVGLALLALLAGSAGPQEVEKPEEPRVTFPAEIEQVTVDVVVTDKNGQPVTDLKPEQIEVYEDGARQTIASFDRFEIAVEPTVTEAAAPEPAPLPRPRVSTNTVEDEQRGRSFVIVFDDAHITPYTAGQAKAAVAEFLRKETHEGDRVTLVAPGAGAWWTARMEAGRQELLEMVKRLDGRLFPDHSRDRLSDYEAMRIHVFRDNMILDRVHRRYATLNVMTATQLDKHSRTLMATEDPYVAAKAAEVYYEATARNHVTLGALERALDSLVDFRGRKSLVLISEGFVYDTHLPEFKRILQASRRANTAIYFVNSRGLEGLPTGLDAEFSTVLPQEDIGFAFAAEMEEAEGSMSLASDSGGFTVRNSNDLAGGLKRIADETRSYYLIGYNPTNRARDGRFRKIEVKVPGRKGIQIRARRGYYAPSDEEVTLAATRGKDPVFQAALDSPYTVGDIALRMTHFVREETFLDKAKVFVATEVDIRDLRFEEQDGLSVAALQFLLVAMHRESGEYFRFDQKMDLQLPPETREQLSRTWLPIVREFDLRTGHYRAKIVLKDKATGRLGTVTHDFEVPELKRFRVSTPVLSDVRETTEDGQPGERLALLARRDFAPQGSLFCQLDVYGAARLEESGMPRVSMGYEVRRSDGTLYTIEAPSLIDPTSLGTVSRLIGFSLDGAAPGDYEIRLRVKDDLSGKTVDLREPFRVATPSSADVRPPQAGSRPGHPTPPTRSEPGAPGR